LKPFSLWFSPITISSSGMKSLNLCDVYSLIFCRIFFMAFLLGICDKTSDSPFERAEANRTRAADPDVSVVRPFQSNTQLSDFSPCFRYTLRGFLIASVTETAARSLEAAGAARPLRLYLPTRPASAFVSDMTRSPWVTSSSSVPCRPHTP